jgi:hypothetical protein
VAIAALARRRVKRAPPPSAPLPLVRLDRAVLRSNDDDPVSVNPADGIYSVSLGGRSVVHISVSQGVTFL